MENVSRNFLIKGLLRELPHGRPFGIADLAQHGISANLAAKYVRNGWLERLAHGTYAYPNDVLQLHACLLYLQTINPGFHVGGKTALSWQGIPHKVSSRAELQLWGHRRFGLPMWFTTRFPARYFQRVLFVPDKLAISLPDLGLISLADRGAAGSVSCRERALLELLNEVGVTQDMHEAEKLFESFSILRADTIGPLLAACTRVKTVRLFLQLADRTGLMDVAALRSAFDINEGAEARWTRRLKDGRLLTLK